MDLSNLALVKSVFIKLLRRKSACLNVASLHLASSKMALLKQICCPDAVEKFASMQLALVKLVSPSCAAWKIVFRQIALYSEAYLMLERLKSTFDTSAKFNRACG